VSASWHVAGLVLLSLAGFGKESKLPTLSADFGYSYCTRKMGSRKHELRWHLRDARSLLRMTLDSEAVREFLRRKLKRKKATVDWAAKFEPVKLGLHLQIGWPVDGHPATEQSDVYLYVVQDMYPCSQAATIVDVHACSYKQKEECEVNEPLHHLKQAADHHHETLHLK